MRGMTALTWLIRTAISPLTLGAWTDHTEGPRGCLPHAHLSLSRPGSAPPSALRCGHCVWSPASSRQLILLCGLAGAGTDSLGAPRDWAGVHARPKGHCSLLPHPAQGTPEYSNSGVAATSHDFESSFQSELSVRSTVLACLPQPGLRAVRNVAVGEGRY